MVAPALERTASIVETIFGGKFRFFDSGRGVEIEKAVENSYLQNKKGSIGLWPVDFFFIAEMNIHIIMNSKRNAYRLEADAPL